jgi:hypothetical protein
MFLIIQRGNCRRAAFRRFHFNKSDAGGASFFKRRGDRGASHGAVRLEQSLKITVIGRT